MKDYLNGKDENFILNFEEKDSKIIINFAHKLFRKNKLVVDKTKTNKDTILNTMANQVGSIRLDEMLKEEKDVKACLVFYGVVFPFFLFFLILSIVNLGIIAIGSFSFLSSFVLINGIRNICKYIKIKDYLKSSMFLNSQEKINNALKEHDSLMIDNMKEKVAKVIYDKSDRQLNINNIDKLSYSELKQLLDAIKKMESFGFEESEGQIENGKRPKLELEQK